jgi:hypothetical protein
LTEPAEEALEGSIMATSETKVALANLEIIALRLIVIKHRHLASLGAIVTLIALPLSPVTE